MQTVHTCKAHGRGGGLIPAFLLALPGRHLKYCARAVHLDVQDLRAAVARRDHVHPTRMRDGPAVDVAVHARREEDLVPGRPGELDDRHHMALESHQLLEGLGLVDHDVDRRGGSPVLGAVGELQAFAVLQNGLLGLLQLVHQHVV